MSVVVTPAPDVFELRMAIVRRLQDLDEADLRLLDALTAEMPTARLAAGLEAETRAGVEADEVVRLGATSRRSTARAQLLAALDSWRIVLGLPARPRRTIRDYLRGGA